LFAIVWAVARAAVQSITIDEAASYLGFAGPPWPAHWYPSTNNHVLNTILMRLIVDVFGLSQLAVRAPALIGAVIYIGAALWLVRFVARGQKLEWPLFVCLVFNPFVFDYLVAARGYSLAAGFLLCAIAVPAYFKIDGEALQTRTLVRACAFASCLVGLSFAANFSFAFVDAATMLLIFAWASLQTGWRFETVARLLAASLAPDCLINLAVSAPVLAGLHKEDFTYGANSLYETLHSIVSASLYELNPDIVNPWLNGSIANIRKFLFPLLGAACALRFALLWFEREPGESRLKRLGVFLGGIFAITVALHWLAFRLFGLLLPRDRTGLFFVPVAMLIAGVLAAMPARSRSSAWSRNTLTSILCVLAAYSLLCLRLNYFKEWRYDADAKQVYSVLAYYNHNFGVQNPASSWMYVSSLNFYRKMSGHESFEEFRRSDTPPPDRLIYVLFEPESHDFIEEQKLKVVYRGDFSPVVVAIRPEAEMLQRR
jgi:hypothetical protein